MVFGKIEWAKSARLAIIGTGTFAIAVLLLPVYLTTKAEAKTPGKTYCYYGTCHRVKTIDETKALVGVDEWITASHYDDCSRDRYNPCGLTSSGERFHPDRPDNTASPIYPDGTTLLVWSPETERALVVRVNNAGPYWGNRTLDLSRAAAEKLGFDGKGVAKIRVRVIKAPQPEDTVYVRNRTYPPVPGDIGEYPTLQKAETGMAVALALQATVASPLAPVTTANAFARPDAEQLVAEAPQSPRRATVRLASLDPGPQAELKLGDFLLLSMKPARPDAAQSRQRVASLGVKAYQNRWDGDVIDIAPSAIVTGSITAKADTSPSGKASPLATQQAAQQIAMADTPADATALANVDAAKAAEVDAAEAKAAADAAAAEKAKAAKAAAAKRKAEQRATRKKIAARKAKQRAVASRNSKRSRNTRTASNEDRYGRRNGRRGERSRLAYSEQRAQRPYRSAGQIMSLGIRAQASSI
jgi:rare lipoprotein A (peptidoglycan hydrolase)